MSATVLLPLPPSLNMAYKLTVIRGHASRGYTEEMHNWRQHALYVTRNLCIPDHTPLSVAIRVRLAPKRLRRTDVDNYIKSVVDVVVGHRCDAWIDALEVQKRLADVGDEGVEVCVTWEETE